MIAYMLLDRVPFRNQSWVLNVSSYSGYYYATDRALLDTVHRRRELLSAKVHIFDNETLLLQLTIDFRIGIFQLSTRLALANQYGRRDRRRHSGLANTHSGFAVKVTAGSPYRAQRVRR